MADGSKDADVVHWAARQRMASLNFIRNIGGLVVEARPGQKSPADKWKAGENDVAKTLEALNRLEHSDDNFGIHLNGSLVDVDVDADGPFLNAALDKFLPPCAHVWGRKSRPRSHRVYQLKDPGAEAFDPAAYPFLRRLKRIDEAKVEVRGGPLTRAEYSLMPGSVHPSEELYEWADIAKTTGSPSAASIHAIIRGLRLAGAVAVLGPYWQEGLRNDLTMALSGFLHRAHQIGETLSDEMFVIDRDGAQRFLEVLLELAGDDSDDKSARIKTFHRTWDKADKGSPVTGANTIGEITGDPEVTRKLYILLTDSPDVAAVDEFTNRFAIWQGPGTVIDMEHAKLGVPRPIMSRQSFSNSWGHRFVTVADKKKLLPDMLFHLASTTRVSGLTFEPGHELICETREGKKINQWSGFQVAPRPSAVTPEEVKPFTRYLWEVVADEDQDRYDWVLAWLAHVFQEPSSKCGTALVLVGKPGAGKSVLGHMIVNAIIGDRHAVSTNSVEKLTKDFNALFDCKLFIQCDEAINNRQRSVSNRLKSLITDPWMTIEPKGVDPYVVPSHTRFLFTSNDTEDAIFLEDGADDRRYTVIEVSDRYKDAVQDFWTPFVRWLQNEENLAAVHRFLLDHKYERELITRPLVTEAKITMQQRSWDPFDAWLATWISRGHPLSEHMHNRWYDAMDKSKKNGEEIILRHEWPAYIRMSALVEDYNDFCRRYSKMRADFLNELQMLKALERRKLAQAGSAFRIQVTEYDEKKKSRVKQRIRLTPMAPSIKVEEYLNKKYGVEMVQSVSEDLEEHKTDGRATEF